MKITDALIVVVLVLIATRSKCTHHVMVNNCVFHGSETGVRI